MKRSLTFAAAVLFVYLSFISPVEAQGTAFTYQGRLSVLGAPANGTYDFIFKICTTSSGPTQIGPTLTNSATSVSNGLFSVTLDAGNQFPGADRWLEVSVRTNGGVAAYQILSPRQQLTPAPYSIRSATAGAADTALSVPVANLTGIIPDSQLSNNIARLSAGKLPDSNLSPNVALLNADQTFSGSNVFNQRVTVNGMVEARFGGIKFPDGSVQVKAATNTTIIASVDMQFSQDDRAGWTHVENLGDDTCFTGIPLGFTYTGFGINTSQVSINSNGVLIFGNNCVAPGSWNNGPLPSSLSSDAMLFFFWDDLSDFSSGEYFEYATFGTAGGRVFNLFFRNRLLSSVCGSDPINVMVSIHESSGLIKASYSGMSGCANIRGAGATFGFQTPGGVNAKAFTVGVDSPVLDDNANRQTMSFHPPN